MASTINVTVPSTSSGLISAGVRNNFAIASNEITALQNRADSLQNSITLVQNQVTPLQASVTALQTKTNVSGDGSLAATGAFRVTALQGRAVAPTAPAANQVLGWSGTQWVPTTVTTGSGSGTVNAGSAGQIGVYASSGTAISGVSVSGDGSLAANGALTVSGLRGRALATTAPTDGQVLSWVQANNAWTPVVPAAAAGGISIAVTAPGSPVNGQMWWDAAGGGLYVWYNDGTSSQWVITSPFSGGGGGGGAGLPLTGGNLSGALGVNTSGVAPPSASPAAAMVLQLASAANTTVSIDAAGGTQVPRLQLRRAGGSLDTLASVPNSAQIGMLEWQGWTGSVWGGGGNIQCISTAGWTTGSAPTRMDFQTTPPGSVLPRLTMWIGGNGGLVVGSPGGGDRGLGSVNAESMYCVGDFNTGGTIYLQGLAVTVGANDSAGPGFRMLRVANS